MEISSAHPLVSEHSN